MSTAAVPAPAVLALPAGPAERAPEPVPGAPAGPPVVAGEQRIRGIATAPTPPLSGAGTHRLRPAQPDPPPLSEVLTWLAAAPAMTGAEPLSLDMSGLTRTLTVNLATGPDFHAWSGALPVPPGPVTLTTDILGSVAERSSTVSGWTLTLRLSGPAAEEL